MTSNALPLKTILTLSDCHVQEIEDTENPSSVQCGTKTTNLRFTSRVANLCLVLSLANTLLAAASYPENFLFRMVPLSNHIAWNAFGMATWYLYSFSWFTPFVFVVVPVRFLTQRVNALAEYSRLHQQRRQSWQPTFG